MLIGLDSKYHNIADKKNINEYIYNKQKIRLNNLKYIINEFLKILYSFKYYDKNKVNNKIITDNIDNIKKINLIYNGNYIFDKYTDIINSDKFNTDIKYNFINDKYINILDVFKNSNNDTIFIIL